MNKLIITLDNDVVINGLHFLYKGLRKDTDEQRANCLKVMKLVFENKFIPLYTGDILDECMSRTERKINNGAINRIDRDRYIEWARKGSGGRIRIDPTNWIVDKKDERFFNDRLFSADFLITCDKHLKEKNMLQKINIHRRTVTPTEFLLEVKL